MKAIEIHKIYRIVIVVNELKEFESSFSTHSKHQIISKVQVMNQSMTYKISDEDIFIGMEANWSEIKERIAEYRHLSYIKKGKLELVYCSDFGEKTKAFIKDINYFHFYDTCIRREDILLELKAFEEEFETELKILSPCDLNLKTDEQNQESKVFKMPQKDQYIMPERVLKMA